jgi:hypothetical protein
MLNAIKTIYRNLILFLNYTGIFEKPATLTLPKWAPVPPIYLESLKID